MGSLKVFKKVLVLITVFLVFFGCLISSFRIPVSAEDGGSNARVQTNIKWAQKKSFQDMNAEDIGQMTVEDLRMIGVFLSNFYIPHVTVIGEGGTPEIEDETREEMVNALVNYANFKEDVAEALVQKIWGYSLAYAKPLVLGLYKDDGTVGDLDESVGEGNKGHFVFCSDAEKTWATSDSTYSKKGAKASYYNFLVALSGGVDPESDSGNTTVSGSSISNNYCLFWEDDSKKQHIVFTMTNKGMGGSLTDSPYSPSQLAYIALCNDLKYGKGIGSNLTAVEAMEQYEELDEEDKKTALITSSQLYIDIFGNILLDFGGNTKVMFPACVNPFTWYDATKGEETAGLNINLINQYFIAQIEQGAADSNSPGSIRIWGTGDKDKGEVKTRRLNFCLNTGNSKLINRYTFTLFANSSDDKLDKEWDNDVGVIGQVLNSDMAIKNDWKDNDTAKFPACDSKVYDYHSIPVSFDDTTAQQLLGEALITYTDASNRSLDKLPPAIRAAFGSNLKLDSVDEAYGQAKISGSNTSKDIPIFKDMCMIDNLGKFQSAEPDKVSEVIKTVDLYTEKIDSNGNLKIEPLLHNFYNPSRFSSIGDKERLTKLNGTAAIKQYLVSIYLAYVYAYYDTATSADERKVVWAFNKNAFPDAGGEMIDWSDIEIESDALQNELMSILYYFMHPSKGIELVKQWFKNKVSGILVGWHEDMVGAAGGVSTSGSTKYVGFAGYVTIPNLSDLAWTDWLLSQYDSLVVYFIILIMVVMLGYVMIGSLTLQRALTGVIIFAICAYLPPKLIDTTVNVSNTVCDSIYSSKFTYWALAQHYQYQSAISNAIKSDNEQQYLSAIFKQQAADSADNYAVVTLKWQCPKKDNYSAAVKQEVNEVTGNPNIFKLISGLVNSQISGESFTETANNLYLYRSYTDVAAYAEALYKNAVGSESGVDFLFSDKSTVLGLGHLQLADNWADVYNGKITTHRENLEDLRVSSEAYTINGYGAGKACEVNFAKAVSEGFLFDTSTGSYVAGSQTDRRIFLPLGSHTIAAAIGNGLEGAESCYNEDSKTAFDLKTGLAGVPQYRYNNTLRNLNKGILYQNGNIDKESFIVDETKDLTVIADEYSLMAFSCYTESPFYYLSFNLRDQLNALKNPSGDYQLAKYSGSTYKDLFLLANGSYFYNMRNSTKIGYGELRDFMDMRSLFTTIIPYLKVANDVVVEWDNTHGLWMYDDVELKFDANNKLELPDEINPAKNGLDQPFTGEQQDLLYKYWHNANVAQLLNIYTPWVDTMYSCNYANPENIYIAGEKYRVENPLDPRSYYKTDAAGNIIEGRNMIFSRSEMAYYGLREDDLTQVERNIIKMYDNVYEALLPLMDYYNFGDEVLNIGAAMLETFEFNKVFSESNPFGEDYTLYPQSYELKNFSYDAFLRLILAETTGEDIAASYEEDGSMYMTIVKNSSILTGIMFILVDLLAVYAIPALKLFFLLAIFALSVLVILCATIKLDISLPRVLWKSLVSPLLKFLSISVGMALAVSLFMSNGNTAVTGRGGFTISLGDPVMVLIVMLLINAIVLVLYYKTVKKVFSDCVRYAKAVAQSFTGMIGGIVAKGADVLKAGKARVTPETVGVGGAGSVTSRGLSNVSRKAKSVGNSAKTKSKAAAIGAAAGAGALVGAGVRKAADAASVEGRANRYNNKIQKYKKAELKQDAREAKYDMLNERSKNENLSQRQRDRAKKNADKVLKKWDKVDTAMNTSEAKQKRRKTELKARELNSKAAYKFKKKAIRAHNSEYRNKRSRRK